MNKLASLIIAEQGPNGSFPSLSAPLVSPTLREWQRDGKVTATTFFTSLVLAALAGIPALKNEKSGVFGKACRFLLSQKSPNWSWNYWQKNSTEFRQFPVPNDLDDTFCAAQALYLSRPEKFPASGVVKLAKLLTSLGNASGGPYKTWIVPPSFSGKWKDVDLAVNCNIAYFLSGHGVKLKNINEFISQAILRKSYASPYYATPYPVLYFLSRAYYGSHAKEVMKFIKSKQKQGIWGNAQDTALAVSALLNLGAQTSEVKNAVGYLTALPIKEIAAYPFCTDPLQKGQNYAAGSKALTAALVLEAITKFKLKLQKEKLKPAKTASQLFYLSVVNQIHKDAIALSPPFRGTVLEWVNQVLGRNKDHKIIMVSYWSGKKNAKLTRLASLGTFYGWMSYLLQDKMLDGDAGPELIPAANYFHRRLNSVVVELEREGVGANSLLNKLSRIMDEANDFEYRKLRLPLYKRAPITLPKLPARYRSHKLLADKSIGFAFGPLITSKKSLQFFRHYLIARQLNDDAHDWETDLKSGRLNSVSLVLIEKWQKLHPREHLILGNAIGPLRPLFRDSVIVAVAKQINGHCKKALQQNKRLLPLITPIQNAANRAITQHQQARALLKIFGHT